MVLQPGQLLCVLAMSNPHSAQKRPPPKAVRQFGQIMAPAWVVAWAAAPPVAAIAPEFRAWQEIDLAALSRQGEFLAIGVAAAAPMAA